jgi:cytochrome c553
LPSHGVSTVPLADAADLEAGKAKVATVCAACHGAAGVSVSDSIPNLAAQRADKPLDKVSYTFTLKELTSVAKST